MKKRADGYYHIDRNVNGTRVHVKAKTQKAVNDKYAEALSYSAPDVSFSRVADRWWGYTLDRVRLGTIRQGTIRCYRPRYQLAKEWFGNKPIAEISAMEITAFYSYMLKQGKARQTVGNQKIVLGQIFEYWATTESYNGSALPTSVAKMPKGGKKEERQPPTDEQLKAVKEHPDGFGFTAHLIMYTGMRLAEANGLQVKDIHWDEKLYGVQGVIYVNKAMPWHGNAPYLELPKTDAGIRKIPVFSPLFSLLKARCDSLSPDDYLLSMGAKPLTKSMYDKRWAAYCNEIGFAHRNTYHYKKRGTKDGYDCTYLVPDITAHQFRHELATVCYEAGVPELVAQKILGHADITTTHKIYTHIRERMLEPSAMAIEEYFKNK